MKESLFEMLITLFETTLLRLKEISEPEGARLSSDQDPLAEHDKKTSLATWNGKVARGSFHMLVVKEASHDAIRVFTSDEQRKLTKASYQFLMRLNSWSVISREFMELVINQLLTSDSHLVSLQETKWTIRRLLADKLPTNQLAYLDLVLYHQEDAIVRH